jgi:hypothetical protein
VTRYVEADYKRMRKGVKKTVQKARRYGQQNSEMDVAELEVQLEAEGHTLRGLEHLRTTECFERHVINKDCAIEAVMAAQDRLDDEEDAQEARAQEEDVKEAQDVSSGELDQRIRTLYDQQGGTGTARTTPGSSLGRTNSSSARSEQRSLHIAASYRAQNRWARRTARDLAAQDQDYVERHVRPTLERELRQVEMERRMQILAVLEGSLDAAETDAETDTEASYGGSRRGSGGSQGDATNDNVVAPLPPSSLSAAVAAIPNGADSFDSFPSTTPSSPSRPTSTSPQHRSRPRPHAPHRQWLQHRDSLQLSVERSIKRHPHPRSLESSSSSSTIDSGSIQGSIAPRQAS